MSNCYAIAPTTRTDSGCTLLNAEAELSASALGDQWIQGLYRPVLKGTKYYEVTTPEGDISYLDAYPPRLPLKTVRWQMLPVVPMREALTRMPMP